MQHIKYFRAYSERPIAAGSVRSDDRQDDRTEHQRSRNSTGPTVSEEAGRWVGRGVGLTVEILVPYGYKNKSHFKDFVFNMVQLKTNNVSRFQL